MNVKFTGGQRPQDPVGADVGRRRNGGWPTGAIFDFDGLIADTGPCWRAAYEAVLGRRGRTIAADELASLNGASVGAAARQLDVPAVELRDALTAIVGSTPVVALPGVAWLVTLLGARMPLAVATNGPRDLVVAALDRCGLGDRFAAVVSAEREAREKPAPDVYLAACRAIGIDPSQGIAFEDSAVGVTAARRAGLVAVQVAAGAAERADADLRVGRLDDPRVLSLLGLSPPRTLAGRG